MYSVTLYNLLEICQLANVQSERTANELLCEKDENHFKLTISNIGNF